MKVPLKGVYVFLYLIGDLYSGPAKGKDEKILKSEERDYGLRWYSCVKVRIL